MLSFFIQHAPSFLIMGLVALGAIFLRGLAEHYAKDGAENPDLPRSSE
ncbi:MAG: hypothetical protein J6M34_03660 [Clostridia bacterium]|nr:hypothetical protein [Clostridia bacterium]